MGSWQVVAITAAVGARAAPTISIGRAGSPATPRWTKVLDVLALGGTTAGWCLRPAHVAIADATRWLP